MTYNDIYIKCMIEYDKNNITSSYPSLTKYEIATILDKAYLAIIAQKLTGNNQRRSTFEADTKAIEDLRPLVKTNASECISSGEHASNEYTFELPTDLLYYIQSSVTIAEQINGTDEKLHQIENVTLLDHTTANRFKSTSNNLPWMENPVGYIESDYIYVLIDPFKELQSEMQITYIYKPDKFVDSINSFDTINFQLSDSMAEELINLAIVFATENVESPRLQTKSSILSLES